LVKKCSGIGSAGFASEFSPFATNIAGKNRIPKITAIELLGH